MEVARTVAANLGAGSMATKLTTLKTILSLSTSFEGSLLVAKPSVIKAVSLCLDDGLSELRCKAGTILVNISAEEKGAEAFLCPDEDVALQRVINYTLDRRSETSELCAMVLSNLSHHRSLLGSFLNLLDVDSLLPALVFAFSNVEYNHTGCCLHYLGDLFSNLTQANEIRELLLDPQHKLIRHFLPFTNFQGSHVRRRGAVGTIRNCCFHIDSHLWLLSEEVDILPKLLLPLAGNEEFDEEDNDKLPVELQYLPSTKERETCPEIRRMLLESLQMLCATRPGRMYLRSKNTYIILRELHKWEKEPAVKLACENIVNLLIRTEDEIGVNDLNSVSIPDDLTEKFMQMDAHFRDEN